MKIWKHKNYKEYVKAQIILNLEKLTCCYVKGSTIQIIVDDYGEAKTVLCHGTRNGKEQNLFLKKYPNAEIVGTEISHTAKDFPMTVQWDFHDIKDEWIGKFDIIYSNAFDHSYDPAKIFDTWGKQLSKNGKLYLEHEERYKDGVPEPGDCLVIVGKEIIEMLPLHGLKLDKKVSLKKTLSLYVISKNE